MAKRTSVQETHDVWKAHIRLEGLVIHNLVVRLFKDAQTGFIVLETPTKSHCGDNLEDVINSAYEEFING